MEEVKQDPQQNNTEVNVITEDQYMKAKPFTKHESQCSKLTEWIEISIKEFKSHMDKEVAEGHKQDGQE